MNMRERGGMSPRKQNHLRVFHRRKIPCYSIREQIFGDAGTSFISYFQAKEKGPGWEWAVASRKKISDPTKAKTILVESRSVSHYHGALPGELPMELRQWKGRMWLATENFCRYLCFRVKRAILRNNIQTHKYLKTFPNSELRWRNRGLIPLSCSSLRVTGLPSRRNVWAGWKVQENTSRRAYGCLGE